MLPEESRASALKVAEASRLEFAKDRRRVRGALVSVLRAAAAEGDLLLSREEAVGRLPALSRAHPIFLTADTIDGNAEFLSGAVSRLAVEVQGENPRHVQALQLADVKEREEKLAKIMRARCAKKIAPPNADSKKIVSEAIRASGRRSIPKTRATWTPSRNKLSR